MNTESIIYYRELFKLAGATPFLRWLEHRLYLKSSYYGLKRILNDEIYSLPCKLEYDLHLASSQEMAEVFLLLSLDNPHSIMELVHRKIFYDQGLANCYLARTKITNEPCYIQWMVSSKDMSLSKGRVRDCYPPINQDEVMLEHAYTFKKYRSQGLMGSVMVKLADRAKAEGYQQMITYVETDNVASLKGCEKAGFHKYCLWQESRVLFLHFRKIAKIAVLPG